MPATSRLHGFVLERDAFLDEYNTSARLWRHERTGARFLSLCNSDENKVFAVTFRTPPKDSTGVAHILEHSVLCGSEKYPVKEPFVELMKGSLQTFLNAFTYPDKTCYPVASTHAKDFYNLMDVYLDAVFFPRITEEIYMQEGWHLTRPSEDAPLQFKGVVYNEMKGAYSSPDSVFREKVQHSLFQDTLYSLDSGGDPAVIPDLTYDAFKAFHASYYHPANAYFFGYGDDPEAERLRRVAEYVDRFEPITVDSAIPLQPPFPGPQHLEDSYAAGEEGGQKAMVAVNWLLGETLPDSGSDEEMLDAAAAALAWHMLEELLVGLPGAPLRQALLDSGLGEDLAGVGLEEELRQMYFSTGLKGIKAEDAGAVETLILHTLTSLAEKGFPDEYVAAAVNTVEFDLRENNTGSFPRGLNLMLRALTTWLYDKDPLALLAFEAPLARLKERLASGEQVFESMIRTQLLENTARTTVLLTPDTELAAARAADEAARLQAITEGLDADGLANIAAQAAKLEAAQTTPDDPELLQKIPHLEVADLPKENTPLPIEESTIEETQVFTHELDTAGVLYVDVGFHLGGLHQGLLPFVPLFGRALLETGTATRDFVSMGMHINAVTGGIEPATFAATKLGEDIPAQLLFLRGKTTAANREGFFDILREILLEATLTDQDRLRQLVLEEKAQMEESLLPAGHMYVVSRLRAGLNPAGQVAEAMGGLEQLFFLRKLADLLETNWHTVEQSLIALRQSLIARPNMMVNMTADGETLAAASTSMASLLRELPSLTPQREGHSPALATIGMAEGWAIPAQVNYVGLGVDVYAHGAAPHGANQLAAKFLRSGHLWDQIRVQGGAYGAFCLLDRLSGAFNLVSYRDPNVTRTLDVFQKVGDYLASVDLSKAAMEKAILGAINDLDAYMLPDAKGYAAYLRHLTNDSEAGRQQVREEILSATVADLRRLGQQLQEALPLARGCILGGKDALASLSEAASANDTREWKIHSLL